MLRTYEKRSGRAGEIGSAVKVSEDEIVYVDRRFFMGDPTNKVGGDGEHNMFGTFSSSTLIHTRMP